MISDESIALTIKIISAANTCFVLPIEWDAAQTALVINRTWRHRLVSFLLLLEYCFLIGYSAFNYTIKSQSDFIIVFFVWVALTGPYSMLFWLNWNCTGYISVVNRVLFLNSMQSNAHFSKFYSSHHAYRVQSKILLR